MSPIFNIMSAKIFVFRPPLKRLRFTQVFRRNKSSLGLWQENINTNIKLDIEESWAKEVLSTPSKEADEYHYVLPMFPYPSGNLHMGHVRVYSISDTIARIQKLSGKNVIHPIGWDAFGLPAENAALEHKVRPDDWTNANINSMKQQLLKLGYEFDWDREFSTCDPNYYKWTQFIFLKLFEKGLAYQSKAEVNWDPVDKTVLADEQVDDLGCSWRSGAKVEKKKLTQWFIKTTKFAKQLYCGLQSKQLENWGDIINLQQHWIGECNGIVVTFSIKINDTLKHFDVWTSEPYKFIHGKFITMRKDNVILEDLPNTASNLMCYNPITDMTIPIYITDDVQYPQGRDIYLASPQWDENDSDLSRRLGVPVTKDAIKINIEAENVIATEIAQKKNVGGHAVSSKLKDWLISRQRYWGTPIPIIHCSNCGTVPVPCDELPVKLPTRNISTSDIQTLAELEEWINCKCPKCRCDAKRETDTMDTFVDSSWYYYRFLDPHNEKMPFDKDKLVGKTPVNIYIGGKEHAVLHLYYARFMSYFLNSLGWTPTEEPFQKLVVQGMVMGQSYKVKSSGKYIPASSVEKIGKHYKEKETGEQVSVQWEKMSKSKHNGENPEKLLAIYGCDTVRLLMLADVPPATSRHWSDATLPGVVNWQNRLWLTMREFLAHRNNNSLQTKKMTVDIYKKYEEKLWDSKNYFIATATYHFKHTHKLSVGISRLQALTSALRNKVPQEIIATSSEFEQALAYLIIMLSPVTPHFSSELWAGFVSAPHRITSQFDWDKGVLEQSWPTVDDNFKLSFQCKVDGADRCDLKIKSVDLENLKKEDALDMVLNEKSVAKWVATGIARTQYDVFPGCRAILQIFTNRHVNKPKLQQEDAVKQT